MMLFNDANKKNYPFIYFHQTNKAQSNTIKNRIKLVSSLPNQQ